MSITFIVGKIPGEVKEVVFDGETLTIGEAVKLGAEVCGFTYDPAEVVYLNSVVVSNDAMVVGNDVVLVDIPKIKGAQMVVKVGRVGTEVKTIALHDVSNVAEALSIAGIHVEEGEAVFIGGRMIGTDYHVTNGDLLVVKNRDSIADSVIAINIYEAIAQLQKDVLDLKDEIEELLETR